MVITKHFLADKLGMDFEIATFFADRKVPANNMYWKGRFLYLSFGTGFLFIPIIADLMFKSGVPREVVINTERIDRMERSFDIVMQYERKRIGFEEYTQQMAEVFEPHVVNQDLMADLMAYFKKESPNHFKLGTGIPALDRADAFLFNYTDLQIDRPTLDKIIRSWYHLAVAHLMLDDYVDLEDDRNKGEENALIELGDNQAALQQANTMLEENIAGLGELNPKVAGFFTKIHEKTKTEPAIIELSKKA